MTRRPRLQGLAAAVAAAVLVLASACAAPPPLAAGAAERMQAHAADVRTAAAAGEFGQAIKSLDVLAEELRRAAGEGDVSFARYQSIEAAVEQMRKELEGELAAVQRPSKTPEPEASPPVSEAAMDAETMPGPALPDLVPQEPEPLPLPAAPWPAPAGPEPDDRDEDKEGSDGQKGKSDDNRGKDDDDSGADGAGSPGKGQGRGSGKDE